MTQLCETKDSMRYRFGLPTELLCVGKRERRRLQIKFQLYIPATSHPSLPNKQTNKKQTKTNKQTNKQTNKFINQNTDATL